MNVQIIGASGFIGQNLCKKLDAERYRVKTLSLRDPLWKNNLGVDGSVIINLVGKAHDHRKIATESDFYYANVELLKEVYHAFCDSDSRLLIHISSLAAQEEFESNKVLNEEMPCNPSSWYGLSKRAGEEWLMNRVLPDNKRVVILRPPMVHGPGDKGNLGLLYKLVCKGIPYPLSAYQNHRSFISIDNFVFFIEKIIDKMDAIPFGIYNISDDGFLSTKEIVTVIKHICGRKTPDIAVPKFVINNLAKIGDVLPFPLNSSKLRKMTSTLTVSNEKIKRTLGISNLPLNAKEGLEKTVQFFYKGE